MKDHLTVIASGIKMITEAIYALDGSEPYTGHMPESHQLWDAIYSLGEVSQSIQQHVEIAGGKIKAEENHENT